MERLGPILWSKLFKSNAEPNGENIKICVQTRERKNILNPFSLSIYTRENLDNSNQYRGKGAIDWLIDWCLTPTLAIFQLYRGANKFYY